MASSIYNHKHLQPAGAPTQGPSQQQHSQARLNDCFETIRQEFDVLIQEATLFRSQRDDFENKVTGQVNELNIIRQSLYDLENTHAAVRKQYEDTIRRLEQELAAYKAQVEGPPPARQGIASLGQNDRRERDGDIRMDLGRGREGPLRNSIRDRERELRDRDRDMRVDREPLPSGLPPRGDAASRDQLGVGRPHGLGGPPPPGEPVIGPGEGMGALGLTPHAAPVGLGVGAGPGGGAGGPGYGEAFYGRDVRERGMERERDSRDIREREMMRAESMRDVRGEPMRGVEASRDRDMMRVDRDREMRDQRMLDRDRDMSRDGRVPIHDRDRERDRDRDREREPRDQREVKRIKTERKSDSRPDQFSPSMNALSHHPHASIALGPAPSSLPTGPLPPPPPGPLSGPPPPHSGPPPPPSAPGATPKLPPPPAPTSAAGPGPGSSYQSPQQPHPPTPHVNGSANAGSTSQTSGPGAPGALQGAPTSGQPPAQGLPPPPSSTGPQPPNSSSSAPGGSSQALETYREQGQGVGVVGGPVVDLSLDPQSVPPELKKEGSDWFAIFSGTKDGKRKSMDVNLVHTFMHESVVCCVRFSHDGKYLATGCNRTAQIYDTKSGAKVCVLMDEDTNQTNDLYIRSVCFSPDGKYLATGAEDKQIRIWDIAKRRICNVFTGHQQEIYSLDFSKDGRLIVSGSGDKTARIWDMNDGSTNKILAINEPDNVDAGVTSVCISPDGRLVAAGSLDTIVRIWDVATGNLVERLKGHRDSVYSVAFTPEGRGLISGSLDKTLKYWDISNILRRGSQGQSSNGVKPKESNEKGSPCLMNFTGHKDYVLSVAVSHDGKWVVSGSKDRGVQFWDASTAQVQCMLQGHKNSVISIDLSPVGMLLATGSGDWQARIWSFTAL